MRAARRVIAIGAATVIVLAGCGSGDTSDDAGITMPEVLADAAESFGDARTFRLDGTIRTETTLPDRAVEVVDEHHAVEVDVDARAFRMTSTTSGGATERTGSGVLGGFVMIGNTAYFDAQEYWSMMRESLGWEAGEESGTTHELPLPPLEILPPLPEGIEWFSVDDASAGGTEEEFEEDFAPFVSGTLGHDLSAFFEAFVDVDEVASGIEVVGEEPVRGVDTTRYRAVEDGNPPDPTVVEIWIDSDGRVRKMTIEEYDEIDSGSSARFTDVEFFDFGAELTIEAPPPEATMPVDEWVDNWKQAYEDWIEDQFRYDELPDAQDVAADSR